MRMLRFKRKPITGAKPGWFVNTAGVIYRYNRQVEITKDIGGLPTVDFGDEYHWSGPVKPPGEFLVDDDGAIDGKRLLDEIVCTEFWGASPFGVRVSTVLHSDDDMLNCSAENLEWWLDGEVAAWSKESQFRGLMREPVPRARSVKEPVSERRIHVPGFTEGGRVNEWIPMGGNDERKRVS